MASVLIVMKGYLPIAETLNERESSWFELISVSLTTISATWTFAASALKVIVISCFLPACKTPKRSSRYEFRDIVTIWMWNTEVLRVSFNWVANALSSDIGRHDVFQLYFAMSLKRYSAVAEVHAASGDWASNCFERAGNWTGNTSIFHSFATSIHQYFI